MHSFSPAIWERNPHFQSILGSMKFRLSNKNKMIETSKEMIIDAGNGVRLQGYYSHQPSAVPKGLVTLIHGWEGSSDSTYIQSTGHYLFEKGYDIFRLNLRDHGNSHHLNEGIFHCTLIEETFQAVFNISQLADSMPYYIVGFSLGGNFSLRIALMLQPSQIPNLSRIFCISPPLDPYKVTLAIDKGLPIYRIYFLNKWKRSLLKKQSLFPGRYDFQNILKEKTCMSLTEAIMPYHPDFSDYREYFKHYTLMGNVFRSLAIPVTIITSEDDPIVPVMDFHNLGQNDNLQILIQRHGGHCGFLYFFPFRCWYERTIAHMLMKEQ